MERTDWLEEAFSAEQARFVMRSAITHHRPRSAVIWGSGEVQQLDAELARIDRMLEGICSGMGACRPSSPA